MSAAPGTREFAPLTVDGALDRLAAGLTGTGTVLVAVDDDPTGAQTVRDVPLVTDWSVDDLVWGLRAADRGLLFVLTNSRAMQEPDARRTAREVASALAEASRRSGIRVLLLSRSDSTLRGHFPAETDELADAWREGTGESPDAVVLSPAYLEAGRITVDGVHLVRVQGEWVPAGRTEFARDATFGYRSDDLPGWAAERSGGTIRADDVVTVDLRTIRTGGVRGVVDLLERGIAAAPSPVVVALDAADQRDLEVAALALAEMEAAGRRFLYRTGPTFVRVRAGMPPAEPVRPAASGRAPSSGVLVLAGSHTELTTRQVETLAAGRPLTRLTLDVPALLADPGPVVDDVAARAADALAGGGDVLVQTSRTLRRGRDGAESLRIAGAVSDAVVETARRILRLHVPRAVVAKGGITSHEVAVRGLGIRRARVLGSLLPGQVSVLQPMGADGDPDGPPFTVFPGNVGDDAALLTVVRRLAEESGE